MLNLVGAIDTFALTGRAGARSATVAQVRLVSTRTTLLVGLIRAIRTLASFGSASTFSVAVARISLVSAGASRLVFVWAVGAFALARRTLARLATGARISLVVRTHTALSFALVGAIGALAVARGAGARPATGAAGSIPRTLTPLGLVALWATLALALARLTLAWLVAIAGTGRGRRSSSGSGSRLGRFASLVRAVGACAGRSASARTV